VEDLRKRYGGVQALDGASLALAAGEVHALVGAHGAGKSTLKNVLAGIVTPDSGTFTIDGRPVTMRRAADALDLGIRAVHQEIGLIPWMSVQDNVHLGQFPTRGGVLRGRRMRRETWEGLAELGLDIDPRRPVRTLSVGQQQLVEIARAVLARPRALLLDEPSAVLVGAELERLFAMVQRLRGDGVAIFYVSHRFDEIFRLADRVTVMRNGATVATGPTAEFDHDRLIREMIGRVVDRSAAARQPPGDDVRLEVRDLHAGGRLRDISFRARRGEILGIAGLMGSGRSHLLKAIYGIDRRERGDVLVDGAPLPRSRPKQAIRRGVVLVPEDRKQAGLVLALSVQRNMALPNEADVARHGVVGRRRERALGARLAAVVGVDPSRLPDPVFQLSGGNQQKVAIGKWLADTPAVLIVDEPTRGIDVEAKAEIHARLTELAAEGVTVLVVSSEWEELLALCHRLLVLRDGRIVGEGPAADLTEEDLLRLCSPTATEEAVR
jgi:rhamnose transport system ATP-binding protein